MQKLTESSREMALAIGDFDIHAKLCVGDVHSNEIFYHKNHASQFHNRYRASQAKNDDGTDQRKKGFSLENRINDTTQIKYSHFFFTLASKCFQLPEVVR